MSLYNVEFFDRNMEYIHNDTSDISAIDNDYLAPEPTEIYISKTDKVSVRDLIWVSGDVKFLGIVTSIEQETNQTKVIFEPFISAFNMDVLFFINRQNSTSASYSLENVLADLINEWITESTDQEWAIPAINTIIASSQRSWTFSLKADSFVQGRCKVNLRDVMLFRALKDYGIVANAVPNFDTKKIDITIGTISGYNLDSEEDSANRFNISADDVNVSIQAFNIDSSGDSVNVLRVFTTDNSTGSRTFFLHNDGRVPPYDQLDEARITPVANGLEYVSGTGTTFTTNATKKAAEVFKNITWKSSIELNIDNNDPLIKPKSLKIGQVCRVWHSGKVYDSILTAKKLGDEMTLIFGSVRTTLTKQLKIQKKN